ncbi:RCC2 like protein, partial [Termitomyces sp. T112]
MVTSVRSDKQEAVLGVNPEGKEVKAKALEALHPFPEGAPGEDSNDVTKSRSNLVRMNKGAGKIKQKPRHVSQVGAQPRGLTRSQTKASTRKVESPNRTGSSVLETLKCHPELQRLKFHKIKQDPLESSTTTFTSLPANSDVMDSSIQSKQPRTAEGVSCSHFESDLNKISQTQSEPSIALVVEGSEEFDTVDSRARTGQLGPTKAAATTNAGEPITETITGEQEQLSTNGEAISMYASENVLNLGPKVHPKAGNTKIQSSWVSRDGIDPKLTRSQLSKRTQQVELSNQTGNPGFVPKKHTDSKQHNFKRDQSEPSTTAVAKVPTGSNAVEINIEPNTIEGPPCTQSELKISALDDTPQTQSGTSIVVPVVEASWGRPTENLSSRTSKVHQKAGDTTIHQVWRVTRSQTKKSTQRFDFSNQSGYSNVEVPKNRTDLKHFKFTKIKKDQPEPNTMTAVAGGRKPVDINMNLRKEELSCAQEESNLPELDDTWQTQSETSIAPVAEASVDSNMERSTIKEFSLPRTQSVSNFSELNDTRQTQSETSMVLVAAVSQVHLTENSPSHVLKVSEKARNVMIKPGGVNPMETRIKNSTQRSEPSNPTGNSVEVPKKRTGWKRQFKEIKKDQPEPSTTTTVLTGSNAIDFNVDSSTNGESQCAQPNRKILELNGTRQSQSDTSIIAHTDSSAVGSNAETSQLVPMKVAPTHEGGLDAETTLPNQQVGNQTSPKHKRKKPPEEQMAAILTVGISQEAETPRKRARRKKVENSDEATELAKEVSPKAVKMPKEQKTKLVKEPKVKSLSTPKAKRVKSFRINLRSILAGKSRPTRGEPQWKLPKLQPLGVSDDALVTVAERSDMQPSIWCSSKEELVSALPELSLTMNGIAWLLSTTPVIFLEDPSSEMAVSNLVSDGLSFELKMTRDFVCLSTDLALPAEPVVNAMPAESVVNISAIKLPSNVNTCGGASYDRTDAQAFNDAASESQNPYTFSQPPHGGLPSRDGSIAENPGPRGFDVEFSVRPPPNGLPPILPSRVPTCTPYAYPFSVACQTQEHFRFNPGITDHTFTNTYRKSPSHGSQQKIACPPAENYLELRRPIRILSPSKAIPSTVNQPPYSWPNAPLYPPINVPAMNSPSRSSNSSSLTMDYPSNSSEPIADPSIYRPNPYDGAQPIPWPHSLSYPDEWNSSAQMNAICRDYGHTETTDGTPTSTVNVEKKGKGKQRMIEDSSVEMGRKPKRARTTRMNNGPL